MTTVALSVLRANAKEWADLEASSFLSDAQWDTLINKGRRELRDLLIESNEQYFERTTTGSTVVDQEDYNLPVNFYKLLAAEIQNAAGDWVTMRPYSHGERNVLRREASILATVYNAYQYALISDRAYDDATEATLTAADTGTIFRILPPPSEVRTYRVRYVQAAPDLSGDTDLISGLEAYNADYIEVFAALRARMKAEKDIMEWRKERAHIRERIRKNSGGRDQNHPRVLGGRNVHNVVRSRR